MTQIGTQIKKHMPYSDDISVSTRVFKHFEWQYAGGVIRVRLNRAHTSTAQLLEVEEMAA